MGHVFPGILITIGLAVMTIVLHELAHGYAALALGDDTALREGRLSLNPIRHVDRVGTLLLPGFLLLSQLATVGRVVFMFGWAKPVPVDVRRFRHPRQMMALVALAGPAMNVALAYLAAHLLKLRQIGPEGVEYVLQFMTLNLVLGLFNLLPLPPLDGGRIMVGILPRRLAMVWAGLERWGLFIVMALILAPQLLRSQGVRVDPIGWLLGAPFDWLLAGILHLAGVR